MTNPAFVTLQIKNGLAKFLAFATFAIIINFIGNTRQHRKINTRSEVGTVSADHRHACSRCGIDPLKRRANFSPHFAIHRIGFAGAVDADVRDV